MNAQATGQLIYLPDYENKGEPEDTTTILSLSRLHLLQYFAFEVGEDSLWEGNVIFFSLDTQDFLF